MAEDTTAPHDLILLLVDDTIEVARPLILNSPLLTESDVLRLIVESGVGHQEAVAGRPNIGVPVTDALVVGGTKIPDEVLVVGAPATVKGPIAGTGAEMWVNVNPQAYQDLARRYLTGLEPI